MYETANIAAGKVFLSPSALKKRHYLALIASDCRDRAQISFTRKQIPEKQQRLAKCSFCGIGVFLYELINGA